MSAGGHQHRGNDQRDHGPDRDLRHRQAQAEQEKGTALLTVLLPAEKGNVTLAAKGFKGVSKEASGTVLLAVKPKGTKKARLAAKKKLTAVLTLTYTPPGGPSASLRTRVTLKHR